MANLETEISNFKIDKNGFIFVKNKFPGLLIFQTSPKRLSAPPTTSYDHIENHSWDDLLCLVRSLRNKTLTTGETKWHFRLHFVSIYIRKPSTFDARNHQKFPATPAPVSAHRWYFSLKSRCFLLQVNLLNKHILNHSRRN